MLFEIVQCDFSASLHRAEQIRAKMRVPAKICTYLRDEATPNEILKYEYTLYICSLRNYLKEHAYQCNFELKQ